MAFVRAAQPRRQICDAIPVRDPLGADPAVVVSDDAGQLTVGGAVTAVIAGKPVPREEVVSGGGCDACRQKWDPIHTIAANFSAYLATNPSRHSIDG